MSRVPSFNVDINLKQDFSSKISQDISLWSSYREPKLKSVVHTNVLNVNNDPSLVSHSAPKLKNTFIDHHLRHKKIIGKRKSSKCLFECISTKKRLRTVKKPRKLGKFRVRNGNGLSGIYKIAE